MLNTQDVVKVKRKNIYGVVIDKVGFQFYTVLEPNSYDVSLADSDGNYVPMKKYKEKDLVVVKRKSQIEQVKKTFLLWLAFYKKVNPHFNAFIKERS
jgi:hypothetical protein